MCAYEPGANPFTPDAADKEALLAIAKILLCPIDRASICELQLFARREYAMNVKAQVRVVTTTLRALIVQSTFDVLKLVANRREYLRIKR